MEDLKLKKIKYGKHCSIFSINKLNFHWKQLKIFPEIETYLEKNKHQSNYNSKLEFNRPTVIPKTEVSYYTSSDMLYGEKNIVVMNICLPCYDEEWCEISGTLRSVSKNILIHRNRPDNSFQLHVNIYLFL